MTDCPNGEVRDKLPDLLSDRLAPDVRRDVEAHVRGCDECRQELALLRAMRASLRRAPAADVAAIAAAIPAYRAPARRSWAGWRAAAAIVILAVGGASVAVVQRSGDSVTDTLRRAGPPVAGGGTATARAVSATPAVPSVPAPGASTAGAPRELATANGAIGDLNDRELSALLKELQSVEVLPSTDVETPAALSPVAPPGTE